MEVKVKVSVEVIVDMRVSEGESGGNIEVRDLSLTGSFLMHHALRRGLVLADLPTAKIPPRSQGTHQPVEEETQW